MFTLISLWHCLIFVLKVFDRSRYSVQYNTRTDTDTCFAYFTHPNSQDLSTSSLRTYRIPYRQHIEYNPQPGSLAHSDLIDTVAFSRYPTLGRMGIEGSGCKWDWEDGWRLTCISSNPLLILSKFWWWVTNSSTQRVPFK